MCDMVLNLPLLKILIVNGFTSLIIAAKLFILIVYRGLAAPEFLINFLI